MNKKELKKKSHSYLSIANRFLNVNYEDYFDVLKKFLTFIENEDIIFSYIQSCGAPTIDVESEVENVINSYGRAIFELGEAEEEEVSNVYHILKFSSDNNIDIPRSVAFGYSGSTKYQEKAKAFNDRVVMVLVNSINNYLTRLGIDMGVDENIVYSITGNGQVNISYDQSTINATQNNGVDIKQLSVLIDAIKNNITEDFTDVQKEAIIENLDIVTTEMKQVVPDKKLLKSTLNGLKLITGTAKFGASVAALITFIQPFLN